MKLLFYILVIIIKDRHVMLFCYIFTRNFQQIKEEYRCRGSSQCTAAWRDSL